MGTSDNSTNGVIALVLVVSQIGLLMLMRATSSTSASDPFDSPWYRWSWLIVPVVGFVVSWARPSGSPLLWAASLMAPWFVGIALLGTVLHDPDDGASFWIVGEIFLLIQAMVVLGAARVGANVRLRQAQTNRPLGR